MRHLSRPTKSQQGFTLVELMIAMVLGLLVVLAATAMLLSTRSTYRTQDEGTRLQENARFALELTNRVIRMAGYTNFGEDSDIPATYGAGTDTALNIVGQNNASGPNGSDSLTIRYFGAGVSTTGTDQAILDCQGNAVTTAAGRVTNTFYVADDVDNEPALFCSTTGLASGGQALIRGVESFQVLYGVPIYAVGADPDLVAPISLVFKRADQMTTTNPWGPNASGPGGTSSSDWDYIRYVRVGMLIRSNTGARVDVDATNYQLFGPNYPPASDTGSTYDVNSQPAAESTRLRRVVTSTITIRNRTSQWPDVTAEIAGP